VPRYRDFSVPQKVVNLRVTSSATKPSGSHYRPHATVGGNVTFTTQIINDDSAQTATNVTVRSNVSSGGTILSCTSSDGQTCGGASGLSTATYSSLAPGASVTLTTVVAADASFADGAALNNDSGVTSDDPNATLAGSSSSTAVIVLNGQPVPVSSLPVSGVGNSQTFTIQFSHPNGYTNLGVVDVLINNFLDARNACYIAYSVPLSTLLLVDDAGDAGGPFAGTIPLGSNATIQNSQCAVGLVSAVGGGQTLTLTLSITFKPGFAGNRILYVAAQDTAAHNSNWQALGVWQAPFSTGTISLANAGSGRPTGPAGSNQQFVLTVTDTKGSGDLGIINLLFNNALDGTHACYIAYSVPAQVLLLVDDAGDAGGPFQSMALNGGSATARNSQCTISAFGSSATVQGNSLTLTLNIAFSSTFGGNRIMYAAGRDSANGNSTGWQALGTALVQ
jgi:hypothetical protein